MPPEANNSAIKIGRSNGVHFIARDIIAFKRPPVIRFGGLLAMLLGVLSGIGMVKGLLAPGTAVEFRVVGAVGAVFSAALTIHGLLLLGPHTVTIDLGCGVYQVKSGLFGMRTWTGHVTEIAGFVLRGFKVRNHRIFKLFLTWKCSNTNLPLATFHFGSVASLVTQEVGLRTGLPVEDET